ncbi:MAG: TetR/AcrR family transcriptional regulator [Desulfobacteraceae bacterium]|nr:TetR/AcrR family transcriptional regulator [Desulfobacteraceae bacterium]
MKIADKHEKIIQSSIKVFARNGFFNSRIAEIAKEANVADGTIYLYFNNKYDILVTIFEEEIGKIIARVKQELALIESPAEKLERFAALHLSLVEDNRDLAEIIQVELRQSSKFMKEYRNKKFAEYVNIISQIVRHGQELGVFKADVMPGIFKRAFFGALDEMSRFWVLSSRKKYSVSTAAKQISDFFINGVLISSGPDKESTGKENTNQGSKNIAK